MLTNRECRFLDFVQQIIGLGMCSNVGSSRRFVWRLVRVSFIPKVGEWCVYFSLKIMGVSFCLVSTLESRVSLRE